MTTPADARGSAQLHVGFELVTDCLVSLNALVKKGTRFLWTAVQEAAFQESKRLVKEVRVLVIPDADKKYTLQTDASGYAMGAALLQAGDDGRMRPVSFASKQFNEVERRYPINEKETMGPVWAVEKYRKPLLERRFEIQTDHKNLVFLFQKVSGNSRYDTWARRLMEYSFECVHLKGEDNFVADFLSRRIDYGVYFAGVADVQRAIVATGREWWATQRRSVRLAKKESAKAAGGRRSDGVAERDEKEEEGRRMTDPNPEGSRLMVSSYNARTWSVAR